MQQAVQIQTQIDQALIDAIPAFKPLLGHRAQITALDLGPSDERTAPSANAETIEPAAKLTFDEFLKHRLERPEGMPTLTLEDMEKAIVQGALDGNL